MDSRLFLLVWSLCSVAMCEKYGYHFIKLNKTWEQAQKYCRAKYTDLVTMHDQAAAKRVSGSVPQGPGPSEAWIGLYHNLTASRVWRWSKPGLEFDNITENWDKENGQPNANNIENCVFVQNGTWHDANCYDPQMFLCNNSSINKNNKLKWLDAVQFCRGKNTDLMSGPQTADWPTTGKYWIGYFRDAWFWSNGSKSSFRNWAVYEPVLENDWEPNVQQCARLGEQGGWKTANCSGTRPFICFDDHMILVKQPKTWGEALIYCRTHHRDLAVASTLQQKRMVQQRANMADTTHVWVGVHFACFFEEWFWVDGHFVQTAKWGKGEPHECGVTGAVANQEGDELYAKHSEETFDFICSV